MKIYFSPEYAGQVFIKPVKGTVMMDTTVVNVIGLISLLELRLGLHYDVAEHERVANYYGAVNDYLKEHPDNVLAASFKTSPLSTAKAMLSWRDELRFAGWVFKGTEISNRLEALIGVEEIFSKKSLIDPAGRLQVVTKQVASQKLDCTEMEIILPIAKNLMRPTVVKLLNILEEQGANILLQQTADDNNSNLSKVRSLLVDGTKGKIKLANQDEDRSLLIYKFINEHKANEYLAYMGKEMADVWVSNDNKQMDNWLTLIGEPTTGSVAANCSPQVTQMFVMGVGLFATPLNVNTLIAWLNMPLHPLDGYFRSQLADKIATEGGYRNEECQKIIDKYVAGDYIYLNEEQRKLPEEEQKAIRSKDQKRRRQKVEIFLPSMQAANGIEVASVKTFAKELSAWALQRSHVLAEDKTNQMWGEQLRAVASMSDALKLLLDTVSTTIIEYRTIDNWLSSIYNKNAFTNSIAQVGSRMTVDSPSKIISIAEKTVWTGVDGDARVGAECSFLYPSERKALVENNYMNTWNEGKQNRYREQNMLNVFKQTTKQLILVVCEHRNGETTEKHPLIVRLEQQVENLDAIISTPVIDASNMKMVDATRNAGVPPELQFKHAENIQWPDHLSPTNIGTLAEYPFDFLMEKLLHIEADAEVQMKDVRLTKGNVAHAVIEELFSPKEGEGSSTAEEIGQRMAGDGFDVAYNNVLESKGAILLLAENKLAEKLLKEQLKRCLNVLLEIIANNHLKVRGCERYVESAWDIGLPKTLDKEGNERQRDVLGFIDMVLEDESGAPVVFDFKWTSASSSYQGLLKENRSVQLEMYRHMLGSKEEKPVERVAYFLMPQARLYSQKPFVGAHCSRIKPVNGDDIVEELRNSVIFRKQQLERGIVETNGAFESLDYVKQTKALNLYPLKEVDGKNGDPGMKASNKFSQYKLFNA